MITQGIYSIINTVNNKIYIGSSINITRRLKEHKGLLKKGKHHSEHLQRAFDKYGVESFKTKILKVVDNAEELFTEEIAFILKYRSNESLYGYNMSTPNTTKGIGTHSEGSKEKMRRMRYKSHNGTTEGYEEFRVKRMEYLGRIKKRTRKHKGSKKIVVLNMDESFLREYDSIIECARDMQLDAKNISECSAQLYAKNNKRRLSHGGYRFLKKDIYDSGNYSFKENTKTIYQQLDDNGSIIAEFVGFSGLDATGEFKHSSVSSAISKGQKYKGFTFRVKPTPYMYKSDEIPA